MGQCGVLSPEFDADFEGRGALIVSADEAEDEAGSSGMLVEDSARWIEAAEGELLVLARLVPRLGLASMLLLRERRPALEVDVPAGAAERW